MQFHLNGFHAGDPSVSEALAPPSERDAGLPDQVDVLIVGCGPAGLTLAAQLSAFSGISTRIIEVKDSPLEKGQADGIACRTMEMFQAFGFADRVLKEAYWVNDLTFWEPDPEHPGSIARSNVVSDTEEGLSEFPHVILNQARVHQFYLDVMRQSAHRLVPDYSRRLVGLELDEAAVRSGDIAAPAVTARIEHSRPDGSVHEEVLRARYVVGCDGARSIVRQQMGIPLHGEAANQAWGVMDVLASTDFPDLRRKCIIKSADEGSIVIIPREGGYLVRFYVELDKLKADERVASRAITVDRLISVVQRTLQPYRFDVRDVTWWSVYEIGQRMTDRFDDVPSAERGTRMPRVFIAGDACHTHSPKAGLGMNVSMQDAFNLGWKLAAVLNGVSGAELLDTYSAERHAVAAELISFDKEWSSMLTKPLATSPDAPADAIEPAEIQRYIIKNGRFTAGTETRYTTSVITAAAIHQALATGLPIGMRFASAPVVRALDSKPVQLGHVVEADGRWRLFLFCGKSDAAERTARLCAYLADDPSAPTRRFTPAGADPDSVIDVRAVLQRDARSIQMSALPEILIPPKGRHGLRDYEKVFTPAPSADIFELRGIDREQGCMVIVRPDQHVANILPLDAVDELASFFEAVMLPANGDEVSAFGGSTTSAAPVYSNPAGSDRSNPRRAVGRVHQAAHS